MWKGAYVYCGEGGGAARPNDGGGGSSGFRGINRFLRPSKMPPPPPLEPAEALGEGDRDVCW